MSNPIIPEARAAAEQIATLHLELYEIARKGDSLTFGAKHDTDQMALIISEHMREREAKWEEWRHAVLEAHHKGFEGNLRALLLEGQDALVVRKRAERQAQRDAELEEWRAALQNAWAEDLRATMTALLEGGPEREPMMLDTPRPSKPSMTCATCKRAISEDEPRMTHQGVYWCTPCGYEFAVRKFSPAAAAPPASGEQLAREWLMQQIANGDGMGPLTDSEEVAERALRGGGR